MHDPYLHAERGFDPEYWSFRHDRFDWAGKMGRKDPKRRMGGQRGLPVAGGIFRGQEDGKTHDHPMKPLHSFLLICSASTLVAAPDLSTGIRAFHEYRWSEAMGTFLEVL